VLGRQKFWSDLDIDVEFFAKFSRKTHFVRFARLALAAGELPEIGEVRALQAARDEKSSIAFDDAGKDDDHAGLRFLNGNDLHCRRIVHALQSGARAAQTVAPKSINA